MIPWMESSWVVLFDLAQICGSNKEGLRGSSITGWCIKYTMGLRKAIHWPKSASKSSDTTPNHEEIRQHSVTTFPKKRAVHVNDVMLLVPDFMPWKCQHDFSLQLRGSSIQLGDRWMIFDYFPYIFIFIQLFLQLILGEWKTPRFTCKIHHPERPEPWLWPNPVTPDSTKRAYRLWTPTCLQGADLGTSGTALKEFRPPQGGEGWGIRYYNSKVFCRF